LLIPREIKPGWRRGTKSENQDEKLDFLKIFQKIFRERAAFLSSCNARTYVSYFPFSLSLSLSLSLSKKMQKITLDGGDVM
jgi:hypothetical protein